MKKQSSAKRTAGGGTTSKTKTKAVALAKKPVEKVKQMSQAVHEHAAERGIESPQRSFTAVMSDFTEFLRQQGVVGLSIAVVLGAAVTKLVGALVSDLINPVIGVAVGAAGDLASMSWKVGPIEILWGHFLATLIDFVIIAAVIYGLVKVLKLDRLDKKKA